MNQIKAPASTGGHTPLPMESTAQTLARHLNQTQACRTVSAPRLAQALDRGGEPLYPHLRETRPHLFSDTVMFVDGADLDAMVLAIAALESVIAHPAYQEQVLAWAGPLAQRPQAARGVFMGYDFHLSPDGPKLIEINTNAGGGLLAACLEHAQDGEAPALADWCGPGRAAESYLAMFRREWQLARGRVPLGRIAIVDTAPSEQYLAPEFELFRRRFAEAGIEAVVADPSQLTWDGQRLNHDGQPVDLVYNRLTDFALDDPAHQALRAAYEADGVVLTPHPRAHALYADKRNLVLLSDQAWLAEIGIDPEWRAVLARAVPATVRVTAAEGERFWAERRRWFFKPAAGFGSRAAYRGDKLTRRVFEEILAGDYIAQEIVPPSTRQVPVDEGLQEMKVDIRNYVYQGQVQLVAARLYQGQTTNFRTPGGGFATVVRV